MAAPAATVRQTPAGIMLQEGAPGVLLTIAADPDISFWELSGTFPGEDIGDMIEITTQHNTDLQTFAPPALAKSTDATFKVGYDPAVRGQIRAILGVRTTLTFRHADGTTDAYYGCVKSFIPDEQAQKTLPTATITLGITNYDTTTHAEQGPTLTSVAGT